MTLECDQTIARSCSRLKSVSMVVDDGRIRELFTDLAKESETLRFVGISVRKRVFRSWKVLNKHGLLVHFHN